jgi:outer membrane receptor protein involved in Fe transport
LTLIHQRKDNVIHASTLPSILLVSVRGEYRLFQQARVFLDVQNLLNEQYEYWRGYQENPFVVSVGIIIRW